MLRFGSASAMGGYGAGRNFSGRYRLQYGAAGYVLEEFASIFYLAKGAAEHLRPSNPYKSYFPQKSRLIGVRPDRKIGILSVFGIGQTEKNRKRLTIVSLCT